MPKTDSQQSLEIVPRRLELAQPHLLRQFGGPPTKHERFAFAEVPDALRGWTSYSTQRHIRDIARDPLHERLWLATWGGVLCWTPATHECIRHTSEHGLPGNVVRKITVDAQGVVWAAGQHGHLATLSPDGQRAWQVHHDLAQWVVLALQPRPQSGVYVALRQRNDQAKQTDQTPSTGQNRFQVGIIPSPDAGLQVLAHKGLAIRDIEALFVDEEGSLYSGNAWGVHRYAANFTTYELKSTYSQQSVQIRTLEKGISGGLWVGTNQGLYHFHAEWDDQYSRNEQWPQDAVVSMTLDADGQLWVVTTREIGRLVNDEWQPVEQMPPGQVNSITSLGQQVWAGGANGLYHIRPEACKEAIAPAAEDALSNLVHAIYCTPTTVWLGASRGLYRFDGHTPLPKWHKYDPDVRNVRAILPDPIHPEQMWIGTWRAMRRLLQQIYIPDQPLRGRIIAICASADHTLWAATVEQLYRRLPDSNAWQPVPACPKTLGLGVIHTICHQTATHTSPPLTPPNTRGGIENSSQITTPLLWVGTSSGLFYYRPDIDQWHAIDDIEELKHPIRALALDPATNALWIGTTQGLWSDHTWQRHRQANIQSLLFDATPPGTLWLGTETGLEKWPSPGKGDPFTTGQPIAHFTTTNSGLASNRITALSLREVEGHQELWIGTSAGVSKILDFRF